MRTRYALLCPTLAWLAACGGEPAPSEAPPPPRPQAEHGPPSRAPQARPGDGGKAPKRADPGRTGGIGPVGEAYECQGQRIRPLSADGPVRVDPPIVRAGEPFVVIVTDPDAEEAAVSLADASSEPLFVMAEPSDGRLRASLRMPRGARCGNKLLSVEGDVSAEAYVAVRP